MSTKISIITPSFNQSRFLEESILSVLNQNYSNLEYLLIDGFSTDRSIEIIKKYQEKIKFWVSEKDNGQSQAINKGFKKATGEIIAWLNSDDILLPNTLHAVEDFFLKNPTVDLVYGDVINFDEYGIETYYHVKEFELCDFISRNSIHQPSVFFKKKLLDKVGLLDETLNYCMDYDLWMRIFLNYNTFKVNIPLAKFRIHTRSKTSSNPKGLYKEYRKILSIFFNSFKDSDLILQLQKYGVYDNPYDKTYNYFSSEFPLQKLIQIYLHACAVQEYSWGNIFKANQLFLKSIQHPSIRLNLLFLLKNNLGLKRLFS